MNTITKWRNYKDNGTFLELALISKQWHLSHFLKLKDQIVTIHYKKKRKGRESTTVIYLVFLLSL